MRHLLMSLALVPIGTTALAECSGQSINSYFTPDQTAAIAARSAATPYGEGLLWQAMRGDDTITLVGTMHLADPRLDPIMASVAPLIPEAELILVEATPDDQRAMQNELATNTDLAFINTGPTLPDLLPPDLWSAASEAASNRGIPGFMAAKMQPWYLTLTLAIPACAMPDIMAGQGGLDAMIMKAAEAAGTPIASLEPWNTVFDMMREGSQADHIEALELGLAIEDLQLAIYVETFEAYFTGEIARLWETSREAVTLAPLPPQEAMALFDDTEDKLLTRRNLAWMPIIAEATEAHDTIIVAAGAAHMPGEYGLLYLLEQDGWTIAPYQPSSP